MYTSDVIRYVHMKNNALFNEFYKNSKWEASIVELLKGEIDTSTSLINKARFISPRNK